MRVPMHSSIIANTALHETHLDYTRANSTPGNIKRIMDWDVLFAGTLIKEMEERDRLTAAAEHTSGKSIFETKVHDDLKDSAKEEPESGAAWSGDATTEEPCQTADTGNVDEDKKAREGGKAGDSAQSALSGGEAEAGDSRVYNPLIDLLGCWR